MELFKLTAALALLSFPLGSLVIACHFCSNEPHVSAVAPNYDRGKQSGLNNYNTELDTYHCWEDSDGAKSCYENCCEKVGRQVEHLSV